MYETMTKTCLYCKKELIVTSMRQKLHAQCRKAYYEAYHKNNYRNKRMGKYIFMKERAKYHVNEKVCEACGHGILTKERQFLNLNNEIETHTLCPNCIAAYRCGLLEALTWKQLIAG